MGVCIYTLFPLHFIPYLPSKTANKEKKKKDASKMSVTTAVSSDSLEIPLIQMQLRWSLGLQGPLTERIGDSIPAKDGKASIRPLYAHSCHAHFKPIPKWSLYAE